jgi:hypothetical protein
VRWLLCVLASASAFGCVTTAVSAQGTASPRTTVWLDLGGAAVQQPTSRRRAAGTVGAGVLHRTQRLALIAEAGSTAADDSVAATQGVLRGQFAATPWATSALEISATSIGFTVPGANGNRSALLRQSIGYGPVRHGVPSHEAFALFAAVGVSRTSRYELDSRGAVQQLGGEAARGPWRTSLTLQRATSDDWQLMEAAGIVLWRPASAYTLHDATLDLSWRSPRVTIGASRSWRAGVGATRGTGRGFSMLAAWQLSSQAQLIAQAGEQLADPLRGVPQARYTGMAMRYTLGRTPATGAGRRDDASRETAQRDVTGAEIRLVRQEGGAEATVTIVAAPNALVEIATSATEWAPQPLTRDGSVFVARVSLPSGTHRIAVRIDGGAWRAPRGLSAVSDDLGGRAGLLVVP